MDAFAFNLPHQDDFCLRFFLETPEKFLVELSVCCSTSLVRHGRNNPAVSKPSKALRRKIFAFYLLPFDFRVAALG
jgi:hypothetical protein